MLKVIFFKEMNSAFSISNEEIICKLNSKQYTSKVVLGVIPTLRRTGRIKLKYCVRISLIHKIIS